LNWLVENHKHLDRCSQILIADFRDTLFQSDPFRELQNTGKDLILIEEGYSHESLIYYHGNYTRVTIGNDNSGLNQKWFQNTLSAVLGRNNPSSCGFEKFSDMPILNSGLIIGTPSAMIKILHIIVKISSYLDLKHGYAAGQGILNFAYYYGFMNTINMKILPPIMTPFVHLTSFIPSLSNKNSSFHPKTNPYVNFLSDPYSIIHQIDRKHIMLAIDKWHTKTWHTNHKSCVDIDN